MIWYIDTIETTSGIDYAFATGATNKDVMIIVIPLYLYLYTHSYIKMYVIIVMEGYNSSENQKVGGRLLWRWWWLSRRNSKRPSLKNSSPCLF